MLTRLDLAILRAAVAYFDEEMTPHGPKAARPYFDVPLSADFDLSAISGLRGRLGVCRVRYLTCDADMKQAMARRLFNDPSQAVTDAEAISGRVGTVLLFPGSW